MIQMNKNTSFVDAYNFWSYLLIAIVFFNYLFFRSLIIDNNSFIYLITFILDYIVLISFFLLVFYKFYNCIFNSEPFLAVFGILFIISGTLRLYAIEINIYNYIELLYFISIFILTIKIFHSIIKSNNIMELDRGIYVFMLISLASSNINYILISSNKIIDTDIFHYISTFISSYMSKLSSFSFLILMIAYILFFMKKVVMKNINKSFFFIIMMVILSIIAILVFGNYFFLIVVSFFGALGIVMYLPFTVYLVVIIMFLMTLFTSFMSSLVSRYYYPKLIVFTLFMLAGLDMSNFALRLISVFAIMEMLAVCNSKKDDEEYLTNNTL
ncbi:WESB_1763 family membrane protein [Brachyspira hampsonii]|uniref:WESB_1763 family membrane protein n=1 Tax=Brachyspira hampsonii TaxID=1287055 RepID=UPI0015E656C8|nr:WESB_1763 family membrane protein [Brachyspira hampsonii]